VNSPTVLPPKPAPDVTELTRPFWDAASRGELVVQRCLRCGHLRFPPGPVCTSCLDDRSEWTAVSGRGTVLSHLVFHQGYAAAWKPRTPYSVLMVQLDEGPRMYSDLDDPERRHVDADLVGRRVEVWFERAAEGDVAVPRFRLVA
jgi:uncharacterized OB-fold protein